MADRILIKREESIIQKKKSLKDVLMNAKLRRLLSTQQPEWGKGGGGVDK